MSQLIQPSEVITGGVARPTPADIRLDKTLISPHIQDAEFRWIVPAIGITLYDSMVADKGSSTAFTSTAYQDIWDKQLKSFCANAVLYEASPYMVMQLGSNGLYTLDNEYGQNVGVEGLKFYQDTLLQRLDVKKKRIKDLLCNYLTPLTAFIPSAIGCPETTCYGDEEEQILDIYNTMGIVL
jgi:hypothetical protein